MLTSSNDQSWWTRREAAAYARVSEATIGREVRNGRLRHVRVGGRRSLRFKPEWIDEWLSSGLRLELPPETTQQEAGGRGLNPRVQP